MKRSTSSFIGVMAIALVVALPFPLAAELPGEIRESLLACASESDDAKRLACYDGHVTAIRNKADGGSGQLEAVAQQETTDSNASNTATENAGADELATATEVKAAAIDQFGRTGRLPRDDAPPELDSIAATITRIEEKPRGERTIYLDNGQAWEETEKARNLPLETGDEITIESGFFGSFQLSRPGSNRFSRVTRTR